MMTHFRLLALAPLLMASPVLGQDFLAPLQDMVEQFTQGDEPAPTRPRATPKPAAQVTPPPVPRPRPPSLPDVPVVETPAGVTVEAEPETAVEAEETPVEAPVTEAEPAVEPPAPTPEPEAEPAIAAPAAPPDPDRVYQVACPAVIQGLVEAEMAPPLSEGICGEHSPLIVTGVMSRGRMIPLSSPVTTNCAMASALPGWVASVDGYASAMLDSPVAQVVTGTSYMCRERVGSGSDFTSEHGFANAVDVTGFTLEDGRSIDVTKNWLPAAAPEGRLLRLAHDAACAGFTTVLGPEANAEHHDHLHLDLGCHGKSCTAQICE